MTLIKSISGIRGTIGGGTGDNLTPLDVVKFTAAFGTWIAKRNGKKTATIVVGRDARISGPMVDSIVTGTLVGLGVNVVVPTNFILLSLSKFSFSCKLL